MISTKELRAIARARLRDAQALLAAKRFDAAWYLSGYAIELALKARICRTLKWPGFPDSAREFDGLQSLKTHDLKMLLQLSGIEKQVTVKCPREWALVLDWNPEKRYRANRSSTPQQTTEMIECVERLLEVP
jgi:HEPN domain-containing protein